MGKIYKNGIEYGGGGSGSGGGHVIVDTDGTSLAQESNLQFIGLDVTDNSTDGETEVESFGLNNDSLDDVISGSIGNEIINNGLVYSTSEQIVGKWIDGRPIYQKTFTGTYASSGSSQDIAHNIANFDRAVNVFGYLESSDSLGNVYNIPIGFYNGTQYYGVFFTRTVMCSRLQSVYFGTNYKVTVQYLKTS